MEKSKLIGLTTPRGWTVIGTRDPSGRPTSSCSSLTYIAENNSGDKAFIKALDVSISFELNEDVQDALEAHKIRLDRFLYEWKLAEQCNNAGVSTEEQKRDFLLITLLNVFDHDGLIVTSPHISISPSRQTFSFFKPTAISCP